MRVGLGNKVKASRLVHTVFHAYARGGEPLQGGLNELCNQRTTSGTGNPPRRGGFLGSATAYVVGVSVTSVALWGPRASPALLGRVGRGGATERASFGPKPEASLSAVRDDEARLFGYFFPTRGKSNAPASPIGDE